MILCAYTIVFTVTTAGRGCLGSWSWKSDRNVSICGSVKVFVISKASWKAFVALKFLLIRKPFWKFFLRKVVVISEASLKLFVAQRFSSLKMLLWKFLSSDSCRHFKSFLESLFNQKFSSLHKLLEKLPSARKLSSLWKLTWQGILSQKLVCFVTKPRGVIKKVQQHLIIALASKRFKCCRIKLSCSNIIVNYESFYESPVFAVKNGRNQHFAHS